MAFENFLSSAVWYQHWSKSSLGAAAGYCGKVARNEMIGGYAKIESGNPRYTEKQSHSALLRQRPCDRVEIIQRSVSSALKQGEGRKERNIHINSILKFYFLNMNGCVLCTDNNLSPLSPLPFLLPWSFWAATNVMSCQWTISQSLRICFVVQFACRFYRLLLSLN